MPDTRKKQPHVTVRLKPSREDSEVYAPLKLPDTLDAVFLAPHSAAEAVERVVAHVTCRFLPGQYGFPLHREEPLEVHVQEGLTAEVHFSCARIKGVQTPLVTSLEIEFSSPLILDNVLPTLMALPRLFDDRDRMVLREWADQLGLPEVSGAFARFSEAIGKHVQEGIGQIPDGEIQKKIRSAGETVGRLFDGLVGRMRRPETALPLVYLNRVRGIPRNRGKYHEVDLAFSGEIGWPDRTLKRFENTVLPKTLIPSLHGELAHLLSPEPLSSAFLHLEQVPGLRLACSALSMLKEMEGGWKAEVRHPCVGFEAVLHDQAELTGEATMERMTLSGRFTAAQADGELWFHARDMEVEQPSGTLLADLSVHLQSDPEQSPAEAALLKACGEPAEVSTKVVLKLHPESRLSDVELLLRYQHPFVKGKAVFQTHLQQGRMSLEMELSRAAREASWHLDVLDARADFAHQLASGEPLTDGNSRLVPQEVSGTLQARAFVSGNQEISASLDAYTRFDLIGESDVEPLPELGMDAGPLLARLGGEVFCQLQARVIREQPSRMEFGGSTVRLDVQRLELEQGRYGFAFPKGLELDFQVEKGSLDATGSGFTSGRVSWDMHGCSPLLTRTDERGEKTVDVLVPQLWQGELGVVLDELGHLEITGIPKGLYDAHFWNALINPGSEPKRWMEIFRDDEAMDRVIRSLDVFYPEGASALKKVRGLALRAEACLKDMKVEKPGDFIPARQMAVFLTRMTDPDYQDPGLLEQWHEVILQTVLAKGFPVARVRHLLARVLPEHDWHFELDRLLRLGALLFDPTEKVPGLTCLVEPPVELNPDFTVKGLPSARQLVEDVTAGPSGDRLSIHAQLAHYLTLEQVELLLSRTDLKWHPMDRARLVWVKNIKQRVRLFSEHYGGVGYLLQPWAISFFLSEAATAHRTNAPAPMRYQNPPCGDFRIDSEIILQGLLGPQDIAALLLCGLAAVQATRTVQVNQHLLYRLLEESPPECVRQVLCALSRNSERILTHVLYGLLNHPGGLLRDPVDMALVIEKATGVELPRQADYLAGGRHARASYYEALSRAAGKLFKGFGPQWALFAHLQQFREDPPEISIQLAPGLQENAQKLLARADALAGACTFSRREKIRREKAIAAHRMATMAFADCLHANPAVYGLPWFREVLGRHFEALQVLSVVRNHQQDVDSVRFWLTRRTGKDHFEGEQDLLHTVVSALYAEKKDQEEILQDPLVRLLWDPPEACLDFSIVSCMGVITEGARGTELAETFERLRKLRGVETVRADTQTARSLEFNAERVIEAISRVNTPYGLVGYSQGCANALCAESAMFSGPPHLRELARGLKGRNFLFSAINGSAHGTCGDWKFHRTMVELDRIMKHYQGMFSGTAIRFFLQNLGALLDSRMFVQNFGGMASLSHEGVRQLARQGQFSPFAPTCILRAQLGKETLPEALELLSNSLTVQLPDPRHDTQVQVDEAVGHFRYIRNAWVDTLRHSDIGCRIQTGHHWSPLLRETEFITTSRDREQAIYDMPKDRHIFPWVDLLHRFGFIHSMEDK